MTSPLIRDPVYLQLNRLLRERLRPDRVRVGDRFLTERQVSEQFGVSRATANKALANLVAEERYRLVISGAEETIGP